MTSQPRDKTRDSTKHDTAKFGIDLYIVHFAHQAILQRIISFYNNSLFSLYYTFDGMEFLLTKLADLFCHRNCNFLIDYCDNYGIMGDTVWHSYYSMSKIPNRPLSHNYI